MTLGVTDTAGAWAWAIAADDSHGYDQGSRWGPDYDCSSLVISAYKKAGVPLTCTYTGNMRADMLTHGFKDVTGKIDLSTGNGLQRGDVLLHEAKHTALCIGGGKLLHAAGNERGGATGGRTGDQTGREICIAGYFNFPWQCVLRYEGKEPSAGTPHQSPAATASPQGEAVYTVKEGDSFWAIAARELGDGARCVELAEYNGLTVRSVIHPGQVLRLPGGTAGAPSSSGQTPHQSPAATASPPLSVGSADISPRRGESSPQGEAEEELIVKLRRTAAEKMKKAAADRGITLAQLIEEVFV